jgi:Asp/Glu/hydantoin racemase
MQERKRKGNMNDTLVMLHTTTSLITTFEALCADLLPEIKIKHIIDEVLLEEVCMRGKFQPADVQRLAGYIQSALTIGARAMLVTCPALSPLVDRLPRLAGLRVYKIDTAMIALAAQKGERIGVLATDSTLLESMRQMLKDEAEMINREIMVEMMIVPEAQDALRDGNCEKFDRLVRKSINEISDWVDCVVLAQASMARAMPLRSQPRRKVPILSGPHLALGQIREFLWAGSN